MFWKRLPSLIVPLVIFWSATPIARSTQAPAAIVYTVRLPEPAKHYALVEAVIPVNKQPSIELMMPIWTPGFYRVQDYAGKVDNLTARTPGGEVLKVERPKKNRWLIHSDGATTVILTYQLRCETRFVTGNWVGEDMLILNGGPSFITLAETVKRSHDIRLELKASWKQSMTGLERAPDGKPHHYRAADFDNLVDSPIMAGNLAVNEFEVDGSKHYVVAGGEITHWDGKRAAEQLHKIVQENRRLWGFLPFRKYVFLFSVTEKGGGRGGLEHANSALMFSNAAVTRKPEPNLPWLNFVSHEYFHAFNVKRLRPVELGPFDYEKEPTTTGLWVAEGLTTYYGDLIVARAGFSGMKEWLARISSHINTLQRSPGRLVQTLNDSSAKVWTSSMSGIGGSATTVSYYVKGPVVGFLLDAKIQRATGGAKSLDDVMKLAYQRYGALKGFTAEQFRQTSEETADVDLKDSFHKWLATTEELDYTEALEWFGLRFRTGHDGKQKNWQLDIRDDATPAQTARLQKWLGKANK